MTHSINTQTLQSSHLPRARADASLVSPPLLLRTLFERRGSGMPCDPIALAQAMGCRVPALEAPIAHLAAHGWIDPSQLSLTMPGLVIAATLAHSSVLGARRSAA
jgi:hypothetical protein